MTLSEHVATLLLSAVLDTPEQRASWTAVIQNLPAGTFYPTQPMASGEPWLFAVLDAKQLNEEKVQWVKDTFGAEALAVQRSDGATLLTAVMAHLQAETRPFTIEHTWLPLTDLLLRDLPLELLAHPADGDQAPGTAWMGRLLATPPGPLGEAVKSAKDYNAGSLGHPTSIAHTLLDRGVSPYAHWEQQPLALHLIFDEAMLQVFVQHGLDLQRVGLDPISPQRTLGEVLRERGSLDRVIEAATSADDLAPYFAKIREQKQAEMTWYALTNRADWATLEDAAGVPALWVAIQTCPAILTSLRKPQFPQRDLAFGVLQGRDRSGREAYFHASKIWDHHHFNAKGHDWLVATIGHDRLQKTPAGDGWIGQHYPAAPVAPQPVNGYALRKLMDFGLAEPGNPQFWWGTPAAQDRLAARLLQMTGQHLQKIDPANAWGYRDLPLADMGNTVALEPATVAQLTPALRGAVSAIQCLRRLAGIPTYQESYDKHHRLIPKKTPEWTAYAGPTGPIENKPVLNLIHQHATSALARLVTGYPELTQRMQADWQARQIQWAAPEAAPASPTVRRPGLRRS
jgi:hypothetical protein